MPGLLLPSVTASIDFLDPALSEKPYSCLGAPPPNMAPTNIEPYPIQVQVSDLRGVEEYLSEFTTDTSGFQVRPGAYRLSGAAAVRGELRRGETRARAD